MLEGIGGDPVRGRVHPDGPQPINCIQKGKDLSKCQNPEKGAFLLKGCYLVTSFGNHYERTRKISGYGEISTG